QGFTAHEARIGGRQGGIGLASGAAVVVGGDNERGFGDGGGGGGLRESVIAGIGAAQAQSRDVDGLVGAGVFVGKGAGGAGAVEGDRVAAEHSQQRGTGGIERGTGGGVIDLVGGGCPQGRQNIGRYS